MNQQEMYSRLMEVASVHKMHNKRLSLFYVVVGKKLIIDNLSFRKSVFLH